MASADDAGLCRFRLSVRPVLERELHGASNGSEALLTGWTELRGS
jgi:hypothetical protein